MTMMMKKERMNYDEEEDKTLQLIRLSLLLLLFAMIYYMIVCYTKLLCEELSSALLYVEVLYDFISSIE